MLPQKLFEKTFNVEAWTDINEFWLWDGLRHYKSPMPITFALTYFWYVHW